MPEAGINSLRTDPGSPQAKQAAKQCLVNADRFVKDSMFHEAKVEVEKARKLDPTNVYLHAFLDRIAHFEEEQKKKNGGAKAAAIPVAAAHAPAVAPHPASSATPPKPQATTATQPRPAPAAPQPKASLPNQPRPAAAVPPPRRVEPAPVPPPAPEPEPISEELAEAPQKPREPAKAPEPIPQRVDEVSEVQTRPAKAPVVVPPPPRPAPAPAVVPAPPPHRSDVDAKLDEMRRQIEMLTAALETEKKAREDVTKKQLQAAASQLRTALELAWVNGAPEEKESAELHALAASLGIPENVERSVVREVKLDMYSRAVKEVITKRQLLRSSSSTLEWLRKVYLISVEEYLEYESKFLLDLVADQYKGTLFLVAADEKLRAELTPRLKASGYAVVQSSTPEDALEKIEKINPNLVICDMEFGTVNLSGIKFLHVLRANSKFNFIPFILFCTPTDAQQLATSELRPNEGFLEKPIDFDELTLLMNEKLLHLREFISSLS